MTLLYDDLCALMERLDRVLPRQRESSPAHLQFSPSQNTLVESNQTRVHQLIPPSDTWRISESSIPSIHTKHASRRWYAVKQTRLTGGADRKLATKNDQPIPADKPEGVRVWHASDTAKRLMILARHDMDELFKTKVHPSTVPTDKDGDRGQESVTLLKTPTHTLGASEGMVLLEDSSPYVVRLCQEYAKMTCWIYGLSMAEFYTLTQMSITRHATNTTATLQATGGGYHDSGPVLTIGLGAQRIRHDLFPSLMTSRALTPVRLTVAEGDLVVLDGHARSNYAHGYTLLTDTTPSPPLYTIDFHMDCMRKTVSIGYDPVTRGMLMETPVEGTHVIYHAPTRVQKTGRDFMHANPTFGLVRAMRSRVQTAESVLISSKYIAHDSARREIPGLQERTSPPPSC